MEPTDVIPRFELQLVHQSCKSCCFATYAGNTQMGCSMGRLDKFREQGTEIVQAYCGDIEFEIVNGRKCVAFRDRDGEWAKSVNPPNRESAVRRELAIRTDVVIPLEPMVAETPDYLEMYDNVPSDADRIKDLLEKIERSIASVQKMPLKPASVTILSNQSELKMGAIAAHLNAVADGLNWRITDIKERRHDESRVDLSRALDVVVGQLKGHFYTVLFPGDTLPETFTLDLDRAVVDELGRFVVMLPEAHGGPGLTVSLGFHRAPMINGNREMPAGSLDSEGLPETAPEDADVPLRNVVEKANYLAKKRNWPHLVVKAKDVCSSLS